MSKRRQTLPRNPRGGLDCSGVESSPVVPEELDPAVYGGTTECVANPCGHTLTNAHWHPALDPRPMGKNSNRRRSKGRRR